MKPKKKEKIIDIGTAPSQITAAELAELQKTESEVGVETQHFICIVYKGPIEGENIYLCPKCKSFYCIKCARALKKKGERCWSCDNEIEVTFSDSKEST